MKTFLKKTTALLCLCMLMPLTLLAQEMLKVQGTVTDASGEPLIGVNVRTSSSRQVPLQTWMVTIPSRFLLRLP